jgi:hypothetical protein
LRKYARGLYALSRVFEWPYIQGVIGCGLRSSSKKMTLNVHIFSESFVKLLELICCGAGGAVRTADVEIALGFTKQKFDSLNEAGGADMMITPCPFCELQLDMGQVEIQKYFEEEYTLDILHVVELLALAFGHEPEEFGLKTHLQYMQRKTEPNWERLGLEVKT